MKSNPSLPKTLPKRRSLENNPSKAEKSVSTEVLNIKKVESKVNSIRKNSIKPRSQIVAAVTSRLYSKTNKKEVATDTDDINTFKNGLPKELTICSNARTRLRELTRKALRAHRQKNVETQTDLFPVLRIKEISTDVADLRLLLAEVKDAETESDLITTKDASVECTTCGTQSSEDHNTKEAQEENEYILASTKALPIPGSPIYTKTVNINISHNYISGNKFNDGVSDNSTVNHNSQNVCFPTPDLISNHNSLEQQSHDTPGPSKSEVPPDLRGKSQMQYGNMEVLQEHFTSHEHFVPANINKNYVLARCSIVTKYTGKLQSINMSNVFAPEICIMKDFREDVCKPFPKFTPKLARPKIVVYKDFKCDDCKPLLIINSSSSSDEEIFSGELPDSLDYHMANNKKVKFPEKGVINPPESQRMVKAMSDFLEEATQLMNNLTIAANNISSSNNLYLDDSYEFEVTLNDIRGLKKPNRKRRRKIGCTTFTSKTENTKRDTIAQTFPVDKSDCCTQCEIVVPINKYEALVEDSCRRLEEKINKLPTSRQKVNISNDYQDYHDDILNPFSEKLTYNPWDLSHPSNGNDVEDSSLESNPVTFSDYGSLPRKTHKRHRTPTCSPSAFLRQLTNMRRQVIESSRGGIIGKECDFIRENVVNTLNE
ncbi:hypothetical protein NQ314_003877 [Rhamnusium bicolor]|uniref:Uncharacterized protein n=1 Tax=Rhamnusium bicolor TaxID=1586634 RepID=A0AAV8ZNM5_9CUCU|nr:hypothetical protein NQ314_003877 [Rhamnusium bicolor]